MPQLSWNPATGQLRAEFSEIGLETARERLALAAAAAAEWRLEAVSTRAAALLSLARLLRSESADHALQITLEMGRPLAQAVAEIEKCASACEFFARHAADFLAPEALPSPFPAARLQPEPLGLILGIMPWNYPYWQVFRAAVPALMAGNGFLLKHASNVPASALALEKLFLASGFPPHLFSSLLIPGALARELIAHPLIRGVTFTGSTAAGRQVAQAAGAALRPTVLEMGGSDPYLVLDDADLDLAAQACAEARLVNAGQSCVAAKRFLVLPSVRAAFTERLLARLQEAVPGDPLDPATTLGPLARPDVRAELHAQVARSVSAGARLLLGGTLPSGPGWFYPPTLLTEVQPGMPAADAETFGPLAAILPVSSEDHAVALANQSPYGLGAAVFSRDPARAERLARRLECGMVFLNGFVRSHPALPFGGLKDSGLGRELGRLGFLAFTSPKLVVACG